MFTIKKIEIFSGFFFKPIVTYNYYSLPCANISLHVMNYNSCRIKIHIRFQNDPMFATTDEFEAFS